jgi:hypothetical protein
VVTNLGIAQVFLSSNNPPVSSERAVFNRDQKDESVGQIDAIDLAHGDICSLIKIESNEATEEHVVPAQDSCLCDNMAREYTSDSKADQHDVVHKQKSSCAALVSACEICEHIIDILFSLRVGLF